MEFFNLALDVTTDPGYSKWICPLLVLADSFLSAIVVWKIPYTEIDWRTYMQQVALFLSGERDYALIKGSTGPLVYPAAHVYIYSILYEVTDRGRNIAFAQVLFGILYLVTLVIVMRCYHSARAPPYIFPLLVLSKRLHSVFLLRLFNDGIATLFLWSAILMLQKRRWLAGVSFWAIGVGVKMTMLLVAPAVAIIVVLGAGLVNAAGFGIIALLLQVLLALPFLQVNLVDYLSKAFEFNRQFYFKWTVNWRFVGEEVFLSKAFALSLLGAHISMLGIFVVFRWIRPSRAGLVYFIRDTLIGKQPKVSVTSSFVGTTMLTSLVIGLLCARSLHYQFFAYLSWASPFLLWKSGLHPTLIYIVWMVQEWAWNVYPSTNTSSVVVVMCLIVQVVGVFWNTEEKAKDTAMEIPNAQDKEHLQ